MQKVMIYDQEAKTEVFFFFGVWGSVFPLLWGRE